jgi:hypothetical protein
LPISEEVLTNELLHTGRLDRKRRGELAELAFMRKAAAMGFAVAKPWGESDRYDVVVSIGRVFSRVQIKSAWSIRPTRSYYRVKTMGGQRSCYSAAEIDFLVAYIFPHDAWYVFPVELVENRAELCINARSRKSRFEPYREAWHLMRPQESEAAVANPFAAAAAAGSVI